MSAQTYAVDTRHFDLPLCNLDTEPGALVPSRAIHYVRQSLLSRPRLVMNPGASFTSDRADVPDAVTGVRAVYMLGRNSLNAVAACRSGASGINSLPPDSRALLMFGGILVHPPAVEAARRSWHICLDAARASFSLQGYAILPGLVPPLILGGLRRHYRQLVQSGSMRFGDGQTPLRYVAHNERAARFFHYTTTSIVAAVAGVHLKPSYVYAASYQPGASLPLHVDRAQCEYSVSIMVDYSPEPEGATPWPLWLRLPSGNFPVRQVLGDALLYRGRTIPHFRTQLLAGHYSTSLFLHYVDASYTGPLD